MIRAGPAAGKPDGC